MEAKKLVTPAPIGTGGDDVTTWALPEGAVARLGQGLVETLAFSPDGHYLAVGTRVGLLWYEVETMSPVTLWGAERGVFVATFSPNGKWIATIDWENLIEVWDNGSLQAIVLLVLSTSGTLKRGNLLKNLVVNLKKAVASCRSPFRPIRICLYLQVATRQVAMLNL